MHPDYNQPGCAFAFDKFFQSLTSHIDKCKYVFASKWTINNFKK